MVSIIICGRAPKISETQNKNIKNTIGNINYEIIYIDNSAKKYSIFEAYQKGVDLALFPYLCFMHEDLIFHSNHWGEILINTLKDTSIGLIGTMGTYYLDTYSVYWTIQTLMRGSLVHKTNNNKYEIRKCNDHPELGNYAVAIDGLWMATRKELFNNSIFWDTKTYSGFHFYDMDLSLQIFTKGYKIKIIDNISIEHKTKGIVNESFYINSMKFHKKWDKYLPITSANIPIELIIKAQNIQLNKICQNEITLYQLKKLLSRLPYKIITKLYTLIGIKIW